MPGHNLPKRLSACPCWVWHKTFHTAAYTTALYNRSEEAVPNDNGSLASKDVAMRQRECAGPNSVTTADRSLAAAATQLGTLITTQWSSTHRSFCYHWQVRCNDKQLGAPVLSVSKQPSAGSAEGS
jgi:hypothetical protein